MAASNKQREVDIKTVLLTKFIKKVDKKQI